MSTPHILLYPLILGLLALSGCGETAKTPVLILSGGGGFLANTDAILFADNGPTHDTGAQPDGETPDSAAPDSAAPDSATQDTTEPDGAVTDTAQHDTQSPDALAGYDTQPPDAGPISDDGTCPQGCSDGLTCTLDGCKNGGCSHQLAPGYCLSGGSCIAAGPVTGSPCLSCQPQVSLLTLQPVVGAACDDGVACTTADSCDASGACTGKPAPGCCKSDVDCVSGAPCLSATCDAATGQCATTAKAGCCQQGACCDPATFAPKLAGSACGTATLKQAWACDGASLRGREAVAGCDGTSADTCSVADKDVAWTAWQTVQTCAQGQVCVLVNEGTKPTCGVAPQCTGDAQCNDGKLCTQDTCSNGACVHPPGKAGVPCGTTAVQTEYQCASASKGAAISIRYAVSSCDGVATTCPTTTTTPVWGEWQAWKTCGFNEVCQVTDKNQPGTCVGAPKCQPGSTCCTAAGQYAAKATPCGTAVVDTEAKCAGGKGGTLSVREAVAGCSGGSTSCYSYVSSYFAWSPWKVAKTCAALETCEVDYAGSKGVCTKKTQCSAGSTCCDKDGFYVAKGSACGTSAWKKEEQCFGGQAGGKGGAIQTREGWKGCTGTSTWCSSSTQDLVWKPWTTVKTCAATAVCEVSWGAATCVTECTPSQACCTATGEFSAAGTTCGSWSIKSEQKCGSSGKGGAIVERAAFYGCSGTSASCSYAAAHYVWSAWTTKTTCPAWQSCEVKFSSPSCGSPCTPSQACCSALGEYEAKGVTCSTYPSETETKCSGPEKGGKILKREALRGCSGDSASCGYSTANYVWGPWVTKTDCKATGYCKGTFSPYCSTTPP